MYQYQKTGLYFAQIAGGLEETGAEELTELGATDVRPGYRGVHFRSDPAGMYRVNYRSRLVTRVLAPLVTFDCHSDRYLYQTARDLAWSDFISPDDTFAVFATVANSHIRHSKFAALRLKDAVVDQFRDATGVRPSIDTRSPSLWLNLHIHNNRAVISIDTSGGSLHRRGYRVESGHAPMQETVAAAALRFSGWDGGRTLYDPMCGSGTLLCEAFMAAAHLPAAALRTRFGFERLPDYDAAAWQKEKAAVRQVPVPPGLLAGSDRDGAAVRAARQNLARLPGGESVTIRKGDYAAIQSLEGVTIICNPPYGRRMSKPDEMAEFFSAFGDFLKQRCRGSEAYVYFGDRQWIKNVGLRATWKKPLVNGALDGRLVKYELY